MAIITIRYAAKCKDCRFLGRESARKSVCLGEKSKRYKQRITQKDLVCDAWNETYWEFYQEQPK